MGSLDNTSMAVMAMAGIRELSQTAHSATGSADTAYTVVNPNTRRVVVCYGGTGATDIRVRFNATAAATHMPLLAQRYVVFEAVAGETIHFYNTTSTATVYVLEML
jgi:hypothetical protein